MRRERALLSTILALAGGCHLIGGAGDIVFHEGGGGEAASGGGGGAGADGGAGGGCESCVHPCDACGPSGICERVDAGTPCNGIPGYCNAAGLCLSGEVLWARSFGGSGNDVATTVLSLGDQVFVAGSFDSTSVQFDNENPITSDGVDNIFLLRLNADDGDVSWVDYAVVPQVQRIHAAAHDGMGNVLFAGEYANRVLYRDASSPSSLTPDNMQGFLFSADVLAGQSRWTWMSYLQGWSALSRARAIAASGNRVVVIGDGDSAIEPVPASNMPKDLDGAAAWVMMFDNLEEAQTTPQRVSALATGRVTCGGTIQANDVVFDDLNRVWMLAEVAGGACVDGVLLDGTTGAGSIVARYDNLELNELSNAEMQLPNGSIIYHDTVNPAVIRARALQAREDALIIAGQFQGTFSAGGDDLVNQTGTDVFVARELSNEWGKSIETTNGVEIRDMAIDSRGYIVVVGMLLQSSSFELDPANDISVTANADNPLVFKLGPTGEPEWARLIQTAQPAEALSVAIDDDDHILVAGKTQAKLAETDDMHQGGDDLFVVKLAP